MAKRKRWVVWVMQDWRVLTDTGYSERGANSIARIWGKIPWYKTLVLPEGRKPKRKP